MRPPGPYPTGTPTVPATVAGFLFQDVHNGQHQVLAPAPYLFETDIIVGSVSLQQQRALVEVHSQTLHMDTGELRTALRDQRDNLLPAVAETDPMGLIFRFDENVVALFRVHDH